MDETPPPSDEQKKIWEDQYCWIYFNCIYGALVRIWGQHYFTVPAELEDLIMEDIYAELVGPPSELKPHAYQPMTLEKLQSIANQARRRCEHRFYRMGILASEEDEIDKYRKRNMH